MLYDYDCIHITSHLIPYTVYKFCVILYIYKDIEGFKLNLYKHIVQFCISV